MVDVVKKKTSAYAVVMMNKMGNLKKNLNYKISQNTLH